MKRSEMEKSKVIDLSSEFPELRLDRDDVVRRNLNAISVKIKIPACAYRVDISLLIYMCFCVVVLVDRHAEFILQVEIVFSIAL